MSVRRGIEVDTTVTPTIATNCSTLVSPLDTTTTEDARVCASDELSSPSRDTFASDDSEDEKDDAQLHSLQYARSAMMRRDRERQNISFRRSRTFEGAPSPSLLSPRELMRQSKAQSLRRLSGQSACSSNQGEAVGTGSNRSLNTTTTIPARSRMRTMTSSNRSKSEGTLISRGPIMRNSRRRHSEEQKISEDGVFVGAEAVDGIALGLNLIEFRASREGESRASREVSVPTTQRTSSFLTVDSFVSVEVLGVVEGDGVVNVMPLETPIDDAELAPGDQNKCLVIADAKQVETKSSFTRWKVCASIVMIGVVAVLVLVSLIAAGVVDNILKYNNNSSSGGTTASVVSAETQSDLQVLAELYELLNGNDWAINKHWTSESLSEQQTTTQDIVVSCNSYGITCDGNQRVTNIRLSNNNLRGMIPSSIGRLNHLEFLSLDGNNMSSSIPTEIGLLSSLSYFHLHDNILTSTLPTELGMLQSLVALALQTNRLSGTLPSELGLLSELEVLRLTKNSFTGFIPSELGLCMNLSVLALNMNYLSGTIPPELGMLVSASKLWFGANYLTGNMPNAICDFRLSDYGFKELHADCEEINCPCCTHCCYDGISKCQKMEE